MMPMSHHPSPNPPSLTDDEKPQLQDRIATVLQNLGDPTPKDARRPLQIGNNSGFFHNWGKPVDSNEMPAARAAEHPLVTTDLVVALTHNRASELENGSYTKLVQWAKRRVERMPR